MHEIGFIICATLHNNRAYLGGCYHVKLYTKPKYVEW